MDSTHRQWEEVLHFLGHNGRIQWCNGKILLIVLIQFFSEILHIFLT